MAMTLQERMKALDGVLGGPRFGGRPMRSGTLQNREFDGGACTGYCLELNNLSYRGIWLGTIEDLSLTVDGVPVSKDNIWICLGNFYCTVDHLKDNRDVFWGMADTCCVNVNAIGGLSKGDHTLQLTIKRRNDFGPPPEEVKNDKDFREFLHMTITGTETFTI